MNMGPSFELYDCTIRLYPNLDTLIVLGCDDGFTHDIYIFAASAHKRQTIVDVMCWLNFRVVDEYDRVIQRPLLTMSNSMPNLYRSNLNTIWEAQWIRSDVASTHNGLVIRVFRGRIIRRLGSWNGMFNCTRPLCSAKTATVNERNYEQYGQNNHKNCCKIHRYDCYSWSIFGHVFLVLYASCILFWIHSPFVFRGWHRAPITPCNVGHCATQ